MAQEINTFLTNSIIALPKKQQMQIVANVLNNLESEGKKSKELKERASLEPEFDIKAMGREIIKNWNYDRYRVKQEVAQ